MGTFSTIAISTFVAGLIRAWRDHRNSLPKSRRDKLFWNDRRYGWLVFAFKLHAAAIVAVMLWLIAVSFGVLCWPLCDAIYAP